jgi:hypothetical protein
MPLRPPAGFISAFYDPLKNPNAPTIGTATGGDASASVEFTPPSNVGGSAITGYGAISTPGNVTATAASSPISVTGLTNGTPYTFQVWALNTYGPGPFSAASGSVTPIDTSNRAVYSGGNNGSDVNTIQYFNITTTGNAADFGDLVAALDRIAACASATRGLTGGGGVNSIDYITIATLGNAQDFGDLLAANTAPTALSSSTRGVFAGGEAGSALNVIQYLTIATLGNATDFGDLLFGTAFCSSCASTTRGVVFSGEVSASANRNVIQYITIATTGNATDFGDLPEPPYGYNKAAACSNSTRGLIAGGNNNAINYITIATTGDAADFGDLTFAGSYQQLAACANTTRATFGGGQQTSTPVNVISYVTIASLGNAVDFGDLLFANISLAACSNAHGGL